jgi:radical SAM superfamily enzyme YgiQ (UPF0313 family)
MQTELPRSRTPAPGAADGRAVRLLLINPRFTESFWTFKWVLDQIMPGKRAMNPPLGLATLAALCPPHWAVSIVDENVESVPLAPEADVVGVCGMAVQAARQAELLAYFRGRGYRTVAGGSYASLCPEKLESLADTVVAGEAEYVWPHFCRDLEAGEPKPLYVERGVVSLHDSPVPRFDLLRIERYHSASMQFSRGCPYRCEFCDIIEMFGRQPRYKRPEQIGRELDVLRALGVRRVFFVDDNLIGNKAAAKALLRFLVDYQREHDWSFAFGTEASINLSQDSELLGLFRAAGFEWVFVGIESPDAESLRETQKVQNLREDVLDSVRRIYASGIDVLGGFIVGFDNDTLETFERQRRFVMASGIQAAMIGLLKALPRTQLWRRLEAEGRLIPEVDASDNCKLGTNFLPKRMAEAEMLAAYRDLYAQLLDDGAIAARIRAKLAFLAPPARRSQHFGREGVLMLARLVMRGIAPGGPRRWAHFLRSLPWSDPRQVVNAVEDWMVGLSMRAYAERHLQAHAEHRLAAAERLRQAIDRRLARHLRDGKVSLSIESLAGRLPRVHIALHDWPDRRFFKQAARQCERLLRRTSSTVTLRIQAYRLAERRHLDAMLERLARYGDQVSIVVHEALRAEVNVDSSRFHLALHPVCEPAQHGSPRPMP